MKIDTKDRFEELIENNKAFSCSGLQIIMRSIVANSKDVIEAQKKVITMKEDQKLKTVNKVIAIALYKQENAIYAYKLLKYDIYKLKVPSWKALAMGVLSMDDDNCPSQYTTKVIIEKKTKRIQPTTGVIF